jgi:hypothetical protein
MRCRHVILWSDYPPARATWGARCGKSARRVLRGGTGTRAFAQDPSLPTTMSFKFHRAISAGNSASPAARKPRLSSWMRTASHWRICAPSTLWKRVDDRAMCPCSKSRSNGAPTSVPRRRMHATFSLPPSIRYRGAVRTRMPEVQIRFKGYLIRETAGSRLGTPPPIFGQDHKQC